MRITDADVAYVANLANLELTDDERRRMVKDLDAILTYIDRLNELDTSDVPPMAQVFTQSGVTDSDANNTGALREDLVEPCLTHEEAMQNAPNSDGRVFRVPKVIERGGVTSVCFCNPERSEGSIWLRRTPGIHKRLSQLHGSSPAKNAGSEFQREHRSQRYSWSEIGH